MCRVKLITRSPAPQQRLELLVQRLLLGHVFANCPEKWLQNGYIMVISDRLTVTMGACIKGGESHCPMWPPLHASALPLPMSSASYPPPLYPRK
eukprot:763778-Hanusia_phi.AAC.7